MKSKFRSGRRHDLGDRFFRSAWEANYARYLNWLKDKKEILGWEYEVDTFEFGKIKRGSRFYLPDFKVWLNEGGFEYHEVKGWHDQKSKTKLKRMKKYYPKVKVILIDRRFYFGMAKTVGRLLVGWEGAYS